MGYERANLNGNFREDITFQRFNDSTLFNVLLKGKNLCRCRTYSA